MARFQTYDVALDMVRALRPLLVALERHDRDLARQARRAATSVPLNLAEGNRRKGGNRLQLFRIAAGSADEVRAALQVARAWGYVAEEQTEVALALLDRVLRMLWGLTHPRA